MNPLPTGLEKPRNNGFRWQAMLGKTIGWGAIVLALVAAGITLRWADTHPRSDAGRITAHVIGIAPRVSGPIRFLPIKDNQLVRAGEVLFEIDPEPYLLALAVAQANEAAVRGELQNAQRMIKAQQLQVLAAAGNLLRAQTLLAETTETYKRLAPLLPKHFASLEQVDTARRAMESAAAAVEVARAEGSAAEAGVLDTAALEARLQSTIAMVAVAQLAVQDCTVRAPFDGRVTGMNLAPGAFARTAVDVLSFVDVREWFVVAEFRESDLRNIRIGDSVQLELMTAPRENVNGVVESMGWGVTDLPQDPFVGLPIIMKNLDWVKLSQRFPVTIRIDPQVPADWLRVGASASATIFSRKKE